jgi:hypothetical protein
MTHTQRLRLCDCLLVLAAALGAVGCGGGNAPSAPGPQPAPAADPKKEAELKWAREIAENFLNDIVARKWENAAEATTKAFKANDRNGIYSLRPEIEGTDVKEPDGGVTAWTISTQEIAPDHDEASFRGTLTGPMRSGSFSLRVVKDKDDGGKWRVAQFSFRPQNQKK